MVKPLYQSHVHPMLRHLGLFLFLGTAIVAYCLFYAPTENQIIETRVEKADVEGRLKQSDTTRAEYEQQLSTLRQILKGRGLDLRDRWLVKSTDDLKQIMTELLMANAVDLKKLARVPNPERPGMEIMSLRFTADYRRMCKIISRIDKLPANVDVSKLTINRQAGDCDVTVEFQVDLRHLEKTQLVDSQLGALQP